MKKGKNNGRFKKFEQDLRCINEIIEWQEPDMASKVETTLIEALDIKNLAMDEINELAKEYYISKKKMKEIGKEIIRKSRDIYYMIHYMLG